MEQHKIVVIDDLTDNLIVLNALINEAFPDVKVYPATSGASGIKLCFQEKPDVVLLDIIMPGMDGFEVCRYLKSNPETRIIPVIMVTASKSNRDFKIKALEAGADAFLTKPLDELELTAQIRAMLRIKEAEDLKLDEKDRLKRLVYERTAELHQNQVLTQNLLEKSKQENEMLRKTELALRESEERFHNLFEKAPLGYQSLDENGCFIEVNAAWLNTLGFEREDVIGKWFGDFLAPEFVEAFRKRFPIFKAQGQIHSEFVMIHRSGERKFIGFEGRIGYRNDGRFEKTHCILQDISERKHAEEALMESEAKYRYMFENNPQPMWIYDHNTLEILEVNNASILQYGFSRDEFLSMTIKDCRPKEDIPLLLEDVNFSRNEKNSSGQWRHLKKNGEIIDVEIIASSIIFNGRQARHVLIIDITKRKRAEESLRERESLLRTLIESAPFEIWARDKQGYGILENKNQVDHFGSILGKKPENSALPPEALSIWNSNNNRVINGEVLNEECIYSVDGIERNYNQIVAPILVNGSVEGIIGFNIDITERKQAEEKLRQSEAQFREFFEKAADAIFVGDGETGIIVDANEAACRLMQMPLEKIIGMHQSLLHPETKKGYTTETFKKHKKEAAQKRSTKPVINQVRRSDGTIVDVEILASEVFLNGKQCLMGTFRNITERKKAEQELQQSQSTLRGILESFPGEIFWKDLDLNYLGCNKAFSISAELNSSEEIIGKNDFELPWAETGAELYCSMDKQVISTGVALHNLPGSQVNADGSTTWLDTSKIPLKNSEGKAIGILGVSHDITNRKLADEALIASEQSYIGLFNSVTEAIYILDENGFFIDLNTGVEKMYGYKKEEVIGKTPVFFSAEGKNDFPHIVELLGEVFTTGETQQFEFWGKRKNGEIFPKDVICNRGKYFGKDVIITTARDISERKQAEELLQASVDLNNSLLHTIPFGMDIVDEYGNILFQNENLEKLFGVKAIGMKCWELYRDDQTQCSDCPLHAGIQLGKTALYETHNALGGRTFQISHTGMMFQGKKAMLEIFQDVTEKKKDEHIQQVLYKISNAAISAEDLPELVEIISREIEKLIDSTNFFIAFYDEKTNMLSTVYERDEKDVIQSWSAEKSMTGYVVKHRKSMMVTEEDMKRLCELGEFEVYGTLSKIWLGVPLVVNKKAIGAIVVQSYDNPDAYTEKDKQVLEFISHQISISIERKKAELEIKDALVKAQESDRLKSAFLANMSHEIRTPLNSIIGFSELLNDPDYEPEQKLEFAGMINASGNNLLAIITDIMDISKIEAGQVEVRKSTFSLTQLVTDIQREYSYKARNKGINLTLNLEDPDKEIFIESDVTKLRQVIINLVGNALKFTSEGYIEIGLQKIGQQLRIQVKDTGIGIPEEHHQQIFERFRQVESSNTRKYGGNGLGLAISKSLVEMLGGEIGMESEKGKGSVFYFTIPNN